MRELQDVTMICVDTVNYGMAVNAITKSLEHIKPHSTIFFTDIDIKHDQFETIKIESLKSKDDYSRFIVRELWRYITTRHILIIQADGYVLDGSAWTDEFMEYDYIGAPWQYRDGRNVGNGGFSLRSYRLMHAVGTDPAIKHVCPEDEAICRLYRDYLESNYRVVFAPDQLAHRFSYELNEPTQPTFGFHGEFHPRHKPMVVLQRAGAMGDIVMMEPVMEHFHKTGHRVVLDIPGDFHGLFGHHRFPMEHVSMVNTEGARFINLNMAYEVRPKQLALKSYYEMCGISDGDLRNPKLDVRVDASNKLFDKYIVFHIDDTAMAHRNLRGIDWQDVEIFLFSLGYTVIQVGTGEHRIGTKINTATKNMLAYVLAGADLFVGIDSGPSQIAVATGVKSVIFFGSVTPQYRYADLSKIQIIQNACEFAGCYHEVVSEVGQDCRIDKKLPPCTIHSSESIINAIKSFL